MPTEVEDEESGEETYLEREAVAVFADERSLNAAVDDLLQAGLRQSDMSLLAHSVSPVRNSPAQQSLRTGARRPDPHSSPAMRAPKASRPR